MPSKYTVPSSNFTSPYGTSFKSGVKSGTPCNTVISNIAKRTGKPISTICKSLSKANLCFCKKFNGTWICWPTFSCKSSGRQIKACQTNMWQCLVDWCIMNHCCTPKQLNNKCSSQKTFMSYCKSLFGKQISPKSKSKSKSRKSSRKSRTSKTYWAKHSPKRTHSKKYSRPSVWGRSSNRSYKFPTYRSRPTTRRYVRAA